MKILITGANGAIGGEVVSLLNHEYPKAEYIITSRKPNVLMKKGHFQLDLRSELEDNKDFIEALKDVTHVIHLAADVRWNLPHEEAINNNVVTTQNLVDTLTQYATKVQRFVFVSTAFVNSPKKKEEMENDIHIDGEDFNNTYEYSKWLSEQVVIKSKLPWSIVRPSLVVGRTIDGKINSYNGLYHLIRLASSGLVPFIVGHPNSHIDIVPCDFVARVIVDAMLQDSLKHEIALAVSGEAAPTVEAVMTRVYQVVSSERGKLNAPALKQPPIVSYDTYNRLYKPLAQKALKHSQYKLLSLLDAFLPYLSIDGTFETNDNVIVKAPDYTEYLSKCVNRWCADHTKIIGAEESSRFKATMNS
jgi:nucleoside-diphosphate-sugar epimerase